MDYQTGLQGKIVTESGASLYHMWRLIFLIVCSSSLLLLVPQWVRGGGGGGVGWGGVGWGSVFRDCDMSWDTSIIACVKLNFSFLLI